MVDKVREESRERKEEEEVEERREGGRVDVEPC